MTNTVKSIIALEWAMFDLVQNIGGRATCQEDFVTFHIMRASQFLAWTQPMRESYLHDLQQAREAGRNLMEEKYAYMMERTSPTEYAKLRHLLPPREGEKELFIHEICLAHVAWLEALQARYPRLTGRGRPLRKEEDRPGTTSFETYLWGELATYSAKTLALYLAYVAQLHKEGQNLNEMILQNTARAYGYASLKAAEQGLAAR